MPRPRTDASPDTPKVLDKALRVLDAFGAQSAAWSEAELRRELGLPSTTLNRILRSLERAGYLMRYQDGRYRLGMAAIRLGSRASESLDLAAALEPELRAAARETGELAFLAVPDLGAGLARYVAAADSNSRLRVTVEVGSAVPLSAGATAKAILAFQPESVIDAQLGLPRERLAAGTLIDAAMIRDDLALIRDRGWGFSWEETYAGAWAVAAPLLDDLTQVAIGAIGVAVPTTRHTRELEEKVREVVLEAAERAMRTIGYRRRSGEQRASLQRSS
jgi:IclR family transcriptional regulator, acetate operon repressor